MFPFWFFLYIWKDFIVYLLARSRFNSVTKWNGMSTHFTSFSIYMISNNPAIHNLEVAHFVQYQYLLLRRDCLLFQACHLLSLATKRGY